MKNPILCLNRPASSTRRTVRFLLAAAALLAAQVQLARATNFVMNANDAAGTSSFNSGLHWTGAAAPAAGNTYQTSTYMLRTPQNTTAVSFAGDSLEIQSGGTLRDKTSNTVTVANLIVDDNATVELTQPNGVNSAAAVGTLAGSLTLNGGTAKFHAGISTDAAGETFIISSTIGGTGGFQTTGSNGKIILAANNPYSGGTTINGRANSTLQLGSADAVANSTVTISLDNGLTFSPGIGTFNLGGLAGANAAALADLNSAAVTLSVGANNADTIYSGILSGPGGLTKVGTGTLTLSGFNSYSGTTTVKAGKLALNPAQTSIAGALAVNDGGTLVVTVSDSYQLIPPTLTLGSSTGATNEFSGLTSTTTAPLSTGTLTLQGANKIVISGSAASLLAGQSYPLIQYGTLAGAGSFMLASVPAGITANVSTSGNVLYLNVLAVAAPVTWSGSVSSTWDINGTRNWLSGATQTSYSDGSPVTFSDNGANTDINIAAVVSPLGVLVNNSAKAYSFSGSPIAGAGDFIKTGNGLLTLNMANTYAGNTLVTNGVLKLGAANAIPSGSGKGDFSLLGGTLDLNGFDQTLNNFSGAGMVDTTAGSGAPTLTVGGGTNTTFSGLLQNTAGALALTKTDAGTLALSSANTHRGMTTISGGALQLLHANALQNSTVAINAANGLVFDYTVGGTFNLGGLSGSANQALSDTAWGAVTLIVGANNADSTYRGALSDVGTLVKTGTGTLTLTGTNAQTGGTVLNQGVVSLYETVYGVAKIASTYPIPNVIFNGGSFAFDGTTNDSFGATRVMGIGPTSGSIGSTAFFNVTNGVRFDILGPIQSAGNGGVNHVTVGNLSASGRTGTLAIANTGNTYNGVTTVSGGTLLLNGVINSSSGVTINGSGATFVQANTGTALTAPVTVTTGTLDGVGAVDTVTVGDGTGGIVANGNGTAAPFTNTTLTFNGNATMNLVIPGDADPSPVLLTTTLTSGAVNPSGVVTINVTNTSPWVNGQTYNLIAYTSLAGRGFANFQMGTIANLYPPQTATLGNSGTAITLTISTPLDTTRTWAGSVNSTWDINSTPNWLSGTTQTSYSDGSPVTFDDRAANTAINIAAPVSPVSVLVNNSTKSYSFSGSAIAGVGNFIKTGNGLLTLNAANTYSGITIVSNGVLKLGVANALPGGSGKGDVSLLGGTLDLNGFDQTLNGLSGAGTVDTVAGGTPTLTVGGPNKATFAGVLQNTAGSLALTKTNAGTLALSNANTHRGLTTIAAGALQLSHANALQNSTVAINAANGLVFDSTVGGTFNLGGLSGSANQSLLDTGSLPVTLSVGANNADSTYRGALSGANSILVKTGTGTLTLTGANAHTGGTVINQGVVSLYETITAVAKIASINANPNVLFNGGSFAFDGTVNDSFGTTRVMGVGPASGSIGGTAFFNVTNGVRFDILGPIQSAGNWGVNHVTVGNLSASGRTGTLAIANTGNTYNGVTTVSGGTLLLNGVINSSSGVTLNGSGAKFVHANTGTALTVPVTVTTGTLDGMGAVDTVTVGDGTGGIIANGNGTATAFTNNTLTFNGAGAMNLVVPGGTTTDPVLFTTTLTSGAVNPSGVVIINVTNVAPWVEGQPYNLIAYTTLAGQGFARFQKGTIANLNPGQTATLGNSGTAITLTITRAVGPTGPASISNNMSGNTLTLTWPASQGWRLQMQANSLSMGLGTNWVYVTDGSVSSTNITVDPSKPAVFYRLQYP